MMELAFRYRHDCPFNDLSRRHPKVIIAHWCNHHYEVLEASHPDPDALEALRRDLEALRGAPVEAVGEETPGSVRFNLSCICLRGPSVESRIERHGGVPLRPIVYHEGWENYRALVLRPDAVPAMLEDLGSDGDVQVQRKRSVRRSMWKTNFLLSMDDLLGELTPRQLASLRSALAAGYYHSPRSVTTEAIAQGQGVPRTTFEEHLRKAENKLLGALAPYVELVSAAQSSAARPTKPIAPTP